MGPTASRSHGFGEMKWTCQAGLPNSPEFGLADPNSGEFGYLPAQEQTTDYADMKSERRVRRSRPGAYPLETFLVSGPLPELGSCRKPKCRAKRSDRLCEYQRWRA